MLHVCVWGGDRAEAIGEVGRCLLEHPGPSPDAVLVASVAIGDVAAESRREVARGNPELVGAETSRVVAEGEFPFAAVDLVLAIMVLWRGLAGARGSESRGRGRGEVRNF